MTWQPVSGCSNACRVGGEELVPGGVAALRIVRCAGVLLIGLILLPVLRGAAAAAVSRGILAALGVRLVWRGPRPRAGTLLVANHVSWLDVVALLTVAPVKLVAKCEVRGWPGIGRLAAVLGAIFLDRSRPRTLPETVAEVTAQLRAGRSVAVFPEGTTYCGQMRGRFRPAMFQAAVDAGAPVVPVAISYDSTAASFIGDDSLWESVRRVAALKSLTVTMVGSPALRPAEGANRKILARAAQASIGVQASVLLPAPGPSDGAENPSPSGALLLPAPGPSDGAENPSPSGGNGLGLAA
jgi:1-acyl-sn-glycerol-3-phosphate acyltransferase